MAPACHTHRQCSRRVRTGCPDTPTSNGVAPIGAFSWFLTTPITSFARNGLKRRHVTAGSGRARSRGGQRQGRRSPGILPSSHREVDSVTLGSTEYISPRSLPMVPPRSKLPPAPPLHRCIGALVDVTQRASNSHLLLTRRQRRPPSSLLPLPPPHITINPESPVNMRRPPPEVLASWPKPNYIDPETRGPALIIVVVLALSISVICLGLRLYVRARIQRNIHWDDWLMIAGAVRISTHITSPSNLRELIQSRTPYLVPHPWCHYLRRLGINEVWLGPSYLGLDHRPNDSQPQGLVGSSVLVWPGDNGNQGLNFQQLPAPCAH